MPATYYPGHKTLPTSVTHSVVDQTILPTKAGRKSFFLHNHSTTATAYVQYGTTAVVGEGFPVGPGEDFEDPTGSPQAIHVISDFNDSAKLSIFEVV